jgi:predicted deacetylase
VRRLWEICDARALRPALLVVPNWHGDWPLEDHPGFIDWCRECAAHGADVFLHGERHDEVGLRRGWADEWRALGRTDREGEFLTLDADGARARIERGVTRLRDLGLRPIGFVAPAWLSRNDCRRAVSDAGLALSEDERAIYLHQRGMRLESPVLRWSARKPWRAHASSAVAWLDSWRHRHHWLVRIALHPQDLAHAATARSLEWALDRWMAARIQWPYSAL